MKISSVVRTRCFKGFALFALWLSATLIWAQGSVITPEDEAIARMAKTIREQSKDWEVPLNEHHEAAKERAAQLFAELQNQNQMSMQHKQRPSGRVLFFVSHSLGGQGLDDVLHAASLTADSMVVFRGVKDEKNFAKSVLEIQNYATRHTPIANVVLDPTLFRDYGVSKVPTIVYLDSEKANEIARVSGLSKPDWLMQKVGAGKSGDLGVRGPVERISERDLIEVMQDKVAAIDWEEKKKKAIQRVWSNQKFIELPKAVRDRTKLVDPTIVISRDIRDAEGNVLVAEGTRINPLALKEFNQALVVFDPNDGEQLRLVDGIQKELSKRYQRVTLIVTRIDVSNGWQSYKSITDRYNAPVYKLTPDIYSRFELEHVPSVVTSAGEHFRIQEIPIAQESRK